MATKAQIRNKALKKLRVLEEGESPTNEVIADVEAVYDQLYAFLTTKHAVTWDSDEEVPNEAVRPVVTLLAAEMADDFGVDENRYARLQIEAYGSLEGKEKSNGGALATLIALTQIEYVPVIVEADYF